MHAATWWSELTCGGQGREKGGEEERACVRFFRICIHSCWGSLWHTGNLESLAEMGFRGGKVCLQGFFSLTRAEARRVGGVAEDGTQKRKTRIHALSRSVHLIVLTALTAT